MDNASAITTNQAEKRSRSLRSVTVTLWVIPTILTVTIGWFSANFSTETQRSEPLGGDFLQEWIGGYIVTSADRQNLYAASTYRKLQHEESLVGFQWPDQRYFPMVYPPFYYALVSPLAQLPYTVAARVWLALMALALGGSIWLLAKSGANPGLLILVFSYPVMISLTTGQKGTLLLLIVTAAYWCLSRGKPMAAGSVFGLIAFKPHLAITLGLLMLFRREWRFCVGCALTVAVLLVISLLTGWDLCKSYTGVCLGLGDYVQTGGYHLEQSFSLWSAWQQLVSDPLVAKLLAVASSIAVLAASIWVLRPGDGKGDPQSLFLLGVPATILMAPHLYAYDLTVMVLPAVLMWDYMGEPSTIRRLGMGPVLVAGYAMLCFVTPLLMTASQGWGLPLGAAVVGLIWMSTLITLEHAQADRQESRSSELAVC